MKGRRLHQSREYLRFSRIVKARLMKELPQPCPRCGQPVMPGDLIDLDHIISVFERPDLLLEPSVCKLAHRSCNRRAGQQISARNRRRKKDQGRLPSW